MKVPLKLSTKFRAALTPVPPPDHPSHHTVMGSLASEYQHTVAEEVEPVLLAYDLAVGFERELPPGEGGDQQEVTRTRLVQIRQHRVHNFEAAAGVDGEFRPPCAGAHASAGLCFSGDGFERAHDARPDRNDAPAPPPRRVGYARRPRLHPVPLRADAVVFNILLSDIAVAL